MRPIRHGREEPTGHSVQEIPKQWLPGWIRWPVRALLVPFIWLDLTSQWVARLIIRPPYKKAGKCKRRGNCCHYLLAPVPRTVMTRLFYFWFTQINGFYLRRPKPIDVDGDKMAVMGCRYLTKSGQCAHYHFRPTICRQWPLITHFGHPKILKGCGLRAVPKN